MLRANMWLIRSDCRHATPLTPFLLQYGGQGTDFEYVPALPRGEEDVKQEQLKTKRYPAKLTQYNHASEQHGATQPDSTQRSATRTQT